jgi:MoxR-like ATPase
MRHRLVLSYEALADGVTPDEILHQVLLTVSHPEVPLDDRTSLDAAASRSRPS